MNPCALSSSPGGDVLARYAIELIDYITYIMSRRGDIQTDL
jgi:hypothetical protein